MLIFLVIVFTGLILYTHPINPFDDSDFVCSHPDYSLILIDQNKERITEIVGQPDEQIIKNNINEYRFGQGEMESQIKEGWIYNFEGWDGHIEIYFNTDGTVIGKNCGQG